MSTPLGPTFEDLMKSGNGCMFCGLKYPLVTMYDGKPGHVIDRSGGLAYCVRDTELTPKRPQ